MQFLEATLKTRCFNSCYINELKLERYLWKSIENDFLEIPLTTVCRQTVYIRVRKMRTNSVPQKLKFFSVLNFKEGSLGGREKHRLRRGR